MLTKLLSNVSFMLLVATAVNCQGQGVYSVDASLGTLATTLNSKQHCLANFTNFINFCSEKVGADSTKEITIFTSATCCPFIKIVNCLEERVAMVSGECQNPLAELVKKTGEKYRSQCAPHLANCLMKSETSLEKELNSIPQCLDKLNQLQAFCTAQVGGNFNSSNAITTFSPDSCCPYTQFIKCAEEKLAIAESEKCKNTQLAIITKVKEEYKLKCAPHLTNCPMKTTTITDAPTNLKTTLNTLQCIFKMVAMDAVCSVRAGPSFNSTVPITTFNPASCCPHSKWLKCLMEKAEATEAGDCKVTLQMLTAKAGEEYKSKCADYIGNCPTLTTLLLQPDNF